MEERRVDAGRERRRGEGGGEGERERRRRKKREKAVKSKRWKSQGRRERIINLMD